MKGTGRGLEALCCCEIISGSSARVVIHEDAQDGFDSVEDRKKDRLIRVIELWCDGQRPTPEQFNGNEGRATQGTINVLIQAFKTHKVRLYGAEMQIEGRRTFVIVEVDPAKKQNKADPTILKRAKSRAIEFVKAHAAWKKTEVK